MTVKTEEQPMTRLSDIIIDKVAENKLIRRLFEEYFDEVVLIDCSNGHVCNISDRIKMKNKVGKRYIGFSYDDQMVKTVCDIVNDTERAELEEKLCLSSVKKALDDKETYDVEFFLPEHESGRLLCKRITFEYLDDEKDVIILVCEDLTNVMTGEIDSMTGLYNSSGFHNHVNKWIKENPGRKFRVQRYNLDRFRDINGVYGYEMGNKLLRDFAKYMKKYNSADSFAAHLNADHFVRFIADDVLTVNQCYDNFRECFKGYDLNIPITLHMGVYDLCEKDCDSFTMSYKALLALQSVKGSLSKKIAYYEKGMMAHEKEQQELLSDIETAIEEEQFEVWFQPQTDYCAKNVVGAEALVRWNHPKKGMLSPALFIPLLERSDYISSVDKYVFVKVCEYMRKWSDEILDGGYLPVSVNLSRSDAYKEKLCETLEDTIKKYNIPPSALHIEMTESAYVEDSGALIPVLEKLRGIGFKVEMDDFGSGYSSLNSLKDLNIDKLKLDMKFLSGEDDNRRGEIILSSIINMAKNLDLPIIAEGVETKKQADMLLGFGCREMQGYYFGKPIPAPVFEELLKSETKR